jgi:transposase-like protein
MARRGYPPEFRRRVVDLVEGGRKVSEVALTEMLGRLTASILRRSCRIVSDG